MTARPVLLTVAALFLVPVVLPARAGGDPAVPYDPAFTVARTDAQAFAQPAPVLTPRQHQQFMAGRSVFQRLWASVNSLNGDWGLGPTFNADRCDACHANAGRGRVPARDDEPLLALLVRLSQPGTDEHGGPRPHPHYGGQLQNQSLSGGSVDRAYAGAPVPAEAQVTLAWETSMVTLAGGERIELRRPRVRLSQLAFGPLGADARLSLRNASTLVGMGLLDAVPDETLHALAQRQRTLGYNGRPNRVWDAVARRAALGRYGWKANQATLREQIARAAIEDMGVSSPYFPRQNCPPVQVDCGRQLPANDPELATMEIAATEFWLRALAVPARREVAHAEVRRGERLFQDIECAVCHVPALRTAARFADFPALADRPVPAYTDLLLHDMGDGLDDGRPDYDASGRDWRTAPLWGLGLTRVVTGEVALLHDGRARSASEAILWHGGEAAASRERFVRLDPEDRRALLRFLDSL